MSKSSEYWARRYKLIEQACHDISLDYLEEMEKKYRDAEQTIQAKINAWYGRFAVNNNISMSEARKWLNDKELDELKWNVEQYIKYGKQNAIDGKWEKELENASAKFHISRLEALRLECRQQIEQLTGGMTDDVDSVMQDTYREGYYRSLYEVQKGVSVGFDVAALDTNLVKRIVNKPWHIDGSDFSNSIWNNKAKLLGVIDKEISKMVLTGSSPEKTIRAIQNQMHTSKSNAQRLVLTESAYFTTRAQADSYGEFGVELYEVVGTLDKRTCDLCGSFDGKKFPVAEMEVGVNAPPFHPRCRCTTCPYDEDSDVFGVGTRAARDENGKTYYVPGDMTFNDWKNKFVDGGSKNGLKPIVSSGSYKISDNVKVLNEYKVDGVTYKVDGRHVLSDSTEHEKEVAELVGNYLGEKVSIVPRIVHPPKISTPDYIIGGKKYDLKEPIGSGKNVLYNMVHGKKNQANNFIFDISKCPLDYDTIIEQVEGLYSSSRTAFIEEIIIIKNGEIKKKFNREK